jgi:hypothetical protein
MRPILARALLCLFDVPVSQRQQLQAIKLLHSMQKL